MGYPQAHLDAVADFLRDGYARDAVALSLQRASGGACPVHARAGAASASSGSLELVLEVLGASPSLAEAASLGGDPSDTCSCSVTDLYASLASACHGTICCTAASISPTVVLTQQMVLGPPPAALTLAYQAQDALLCAAWPDQPQVLVLRVSQAGALDAALLRLPGDAAVVDVAFYKPGQLALAIEGEAGSLDMLELEALAFVELPPAALAESDLLSLCQLLAESTGGPTERPAERRRRRLPCSAATGGVQAPLAVSASRGVGCVLVGTQVGVHASLVSCAAAWWGVRGCAPCQPQTLACSVALLCCQRVLLYDLEEDEDEQGDAPEDSESEAAE